MGMPTNIPPTLYMTNLMLMANYNYMKNCIKSSLRG